MSYDATELRDRIKELRRVPASHLRANPKNWRVHPARQRSALSGMLREVGLADALLARELGDGTLELVDGHLRADLAHDAVVPVLVLDLSEAEADKLLVFLDPLTSLAEADHERLGSLVATIETDNEALGAILSEMTDAERTSELSCDQKTPTLSACYQVIVDCEDEDAQRHAYEMLTAEGFQCRVLTL